MRAVRTRDTEPERAVRRLLWGLGYRYRICPSNLPGKPDVANRRHAWCIFVHGCFWHGHEGCSLGRLPRANRDWWRTKIAGNRERDARKEGTLRASGYRVLVVWQCELQNEARLRDRLGRFVEGEPLAAGAGGAAS